MDYQSDTPSHIRILLERNNIDEFCLLGLKKKKPISCYAVVTLMIMFWIKYSPTANLKNTFFNEIHKYIINNNFNKTNELFDISTIYQIIQNKANALNYNPYVPIIIWDMLYNESIVNEITMTFLKK